MLLKLTFACLIVWIFLPFSPRSIKMEIQRKSKRLHATKKITQVISPVLFQETLSDYSFSVPSNSLKIFILHLAYTMLLNPQNLTGSLRQSILIVAESSGPFLCCVQTESGEVWSAAQGSAEFFVFTLQTPPVMRALKTLDHKPSPVTKSYHQPLMTAHIILRSFFSCVGKRCTTFKNLLFLMLCNGI